MRNSADDVSSNVFALAYALDHLHHHETVIEKAVKSDSNIVIVQERSLLSTLIYQGILGDVDLKWLKEINKYDKNYPHLSIILKVDLSELLKRKKLENRQFDKFEEEEHLKGQIKIYYNLPQDIASDFHVEYVNANESPLEVAKMCAEKVQREIDKMLEMEEVIPEHTNKKIDSLTSF